MTRGKGFLFTLIPASIYPLHTNKTQPTLPHKKNANNKPPPNALFPPPPTTTFYFEPPPSTPTHSFRPCDPRRPGNPQHPPSLTETSTTSTPTGTPVGRIVFAEDGLPVRRQTPADGTGAEAVSARRRRALALRRGKRG